MPSELFGSVSHAAPATRSRSGTVVTISIAMHAIVILGAAFFSIATPGLLPTTREALAWIDTARFVKVDIQLPTPPPQPSPAHVTAAAAPASIDTSSIDAPPVVAPTGIQPERSYEALPPGPNRAVVDGIERGAVLGDGLRIERVERLPPPPPPQTPVRLHSGIRSPVKVLHVDPTYPSLAQNARVEGVVILEAVIGKSGRVESVEVLRSIPLLDDAAVRAVRQWQYRPAMLNGEPVPVIVTVTVQFKL